MKTRICRKYDLGKAEDRNYVANGKACKGWSLREDKMAVKQQTGNSTIW